MAKYQPSSDIRIAKPCSESWEEMQGGSRVRYCTACELDVHNLVALTPAQIDGLMEAPGPLPCMRIARYADGSLLVAEEQSQRAAYGPFAAAAIVALVTLSGAANAQLTSGKAASRAIYAGRLVDSFGRPVAKAEVYLSRTIDEQTDRAKAETNGNGEFTFKVAPGNWQLKAASQKGDSGLSAVPLHLVPGAQKANRPFTLQPITITAGIPAIASAQKPLPSSIPIAGSGHAVFPLENLLPPPKK